MCIYTKELFYHSMTNYLCIDTGKNIAWLKTAYKEDNILTQAEFEFWFEWFLLCEYFPLTAEKKSTKEGFLFSKKSHINYKGYGTFSEANHDNFTYDDWLDNVIFSVAPFYGGINVYYKLMPKLIKENQEHEYLLKSDEMDRILKIQKSFTIQDAWKQWGRRKNKYKEMSKTALDIGSKVHELIEKQIKEG